MIGRAPKASSAVSIGTGFEATRSSRRLRSWEPTKSDVNTILAAGGERLLRRSRDLVRNNSYATNAVSEFSAAAVGGGIKPSSLVADPGLKREIQQAFLDWTDESDADGMTDFYGLQAMIARGDIEAGETFARFRPRRPSDGLSVPLQIQLLEAEMLPYELNFNPSGTGRNQVRCGIEFDGIGKRTRYHFYDRHPGDAVSTKISERQYVPVDARQIMHIMRADRPGQIRGVPGLAAAMVKLQFLEQYDDAELERKKTAALYAAFVRKPQHDQPAADEELDADNVPLVSLEAGTVQELLPGEDMVFSEPADVGGNYEVFQYRVLLAICAAIGVPYASVTGDLRQVNYSSIRSGLVQLKRRIDQWQHRTMIFQFCRPVWQAWMDAAVMSGRLQINDYAERRSEYQRVKWITPAWDWVDPKKDREAEAIAVQQGWKSRSDVVEAEGYDIEEVDERIAQDRAREKALGIDFSNPGAPKKSLESQDIDKEGVEDAA